MFRKFISIILLVFLSSGFVRADLESARAAYEAGEYDTALELLIPLAEAGDAKAQTTLGWMYTEGKGVPQDSVLAHMWANLAAANGAKRASKVRDFLTKNMTLADISKAQRHAFGAFNKDRTC